MQTALNKFGDGNRFKHPAIATVIFERSASGPCAERSPKDRHLLRHRSIKQRQSPTGLHRSIIIQATINAYAAGDFITSCPCRRRDRARNRQEGVDGYIEPVSAYYQWALPIEFLWHGVRSQISMIPTYYLLVSSLSKS